MSILLVFKQSQLRIVASQNRTSPQIRYSGHNHLQRALRYILKCVSQTTRLQAPSHHILNTYELKVTEVRKVVMSGSGGYWLRSSMRGTLWGAGNVHILNCVVVTRLYNTEKLSCTFMISVLNTFYYISFIHPKLE